MGEAMRLLGVALRFLTRLPVPQVRVGEGDLQRASGAFPLVGLLVGAIGVAVRAGAEPLWGPVPSTIAAVAAMVAVTGALHEDGLADTADGVWGGWDPQQRVAIMRDSRIGTYGILALVGTLALRVSLLSALPLGPFIAATLCGAVLGRASILVMARLLPAAAAGSGASVLGAQPLGGVALAGTTVAAVLGVAAGVWAPALIVAGLVVIAACRRLYRRRLGGLTGDTLGATNQLVELAAIAVVAAAWGAGRW